MMKKVVIISLVFIILLSVLLYLSKESYRKFKELSRLGLERTEQLNSEIISDKDLVDLPQPVQKYLKFVGVVGKEKVRNMQISIDGQMKVDMNKDWTPVQVEQVSFFDRMTRLFHIKMNMMGLPISGLHNYDQGTATMLIKILGLFKVVDGKGKEMNIGETVTVFNDMCILAPATLIDKRITWEYIDDQTVKGTFTYNDIAISAVLYFNKEGQLINFVSEDRYYSPTGKTYEKVTWSTPVSQYRNINGYNLATYGEAIWKFKDKDYTYAKFNFMDIVYN